MHVLALDLSNYKLCHPAVDDDDEMPVWGAFTLLWSLGVKTFEVIIFLNV